MGSVMVQDSFVSYLPGADEVLKENVKDTDPPEVPINEGICNVSTWAMCNLDACIIQPCPSRQISEAQKASWAIACEQRTAKKALLDKAVQEYLAQQTLKMEEIALKHDVMVEYLKGIAQWHNALLHAKALEVNADRPSGSKYSLKEIQKMVKEDKQLQNLTQEEMDQYITDVLATANKIAKELHGLCNRTGIYATLLTTLQSLGRMFLGTRLWMLLVNMSNGPAPRIKANLLECDSLRNLHKQITKAISSGLERITNKKLIVVNYHSYESAIVETYGVHLVGWPDGVKFANPSAIGTVAEAQKLCNALHSGSSFWKKLSKNELELFITELNTHHAVGETMQKPRKKCSDAGIPWKHKAPTCGKENIQLQKKIHSSHKHVLPKSAEIIPTSDEDDSEDM
ncbi:hypothetical protein EDC04DRAFT_2900601 [Pisolithus marmoratus]|nr:hypothetical protein EDC04DRAFT_2900601 [Pisolithus marmoratus]